MTQSPPFLSDVAHIMDTHPAVIYSDSPMSAVRDGGDSPVTEGPVAVIDRDGTFRGVLDPSAFLVESVATAGMLASRPRLTATPGEPAFRLISRMLNRRAEWVPVIAAGKLAGVITRRCITAAFGETYGA